MGVLLSKECSSLVSTTPDVCGEVVLTSYVHHDIVHESGRKLTHLQVIRPEVTRANQQAPEQSDHRGQERQCCHEGEERCSERRPRWSRWSVSLAKASEPSVDWEERICSRE